MGYSIAALMIDPLHMKFGQRGMAILGPAFRLLAYIVLSMHPPYPVAVVVFAFAGLGNGILDVGGPSSVILLGANKPETGWLQCLGGQSGQY